MMYSALHLINVRVASVLECLVGFVAGASRVHSFGAMDEYLADLALVEPIELEAGAAAEELGADEGAGAGAADGHALKQPAASAAGAPKKVVKKPAAASAAGAPQVLKKPAAAAGAPKQLKKPGSSSDPVETEEDEEEEAEEEGGKENDLLRDRLKSRKFDRIFSSLPAYVQAEYKDALALRDGTSRAKCTKIINNVVRRGPNGFVISDEKCAFFREVLQRQKIKSFTQGKTGVIREEAEVRAGGEAKLEAAIKRGAVQEIGPENGEKLYYFRAVTVAETEQLHEAQEISRGKTTTMAAFKVHQDSILKFGWKIQTKPIDLEARDIATSCLHQDCSTHLDIIVMVIMDCAIASYTVAS